MIEGSRWQIREFIAENELQRYHCKGRKKITVQWTEISVGPCSICRLECCDPGGEDECGFCIRKIYIVKD